MYCGRKRWLRLPRSVEYSREIWFSCSMEWVKYENLNLKLVRLVHRLHELANFGQWVVFILLRGQGNSPTLKKNRHKGILYLLLSILCNLFQITPRFSISNGYNRRLHLSLERPSSINTIRGVLIWAASFSRGHSQFRISSGFSKKMCGIFHYRGHHQQTLTFFDSVSHSSDISRLSLLVTSTSDNFHLL